MRRRLLVTCFVSCGVSFVAAQPNPSPNSDRSVDPLPPIFAPRAVPQAATSGGASRPASAPPPARRAISPELAAKLSALATLAAQTASPTTSARVAAPAPQRDSSDAVQLKPYVVQEDRLPEFKERDMLTPKGKLELARRRYPGLVGPLSGAAALRMLEEDFALERRREMADLQGLLEIGGDKPSRDLKRKIDEATMRPSGFSPEVGAPFRPPK